MTILIITFAFFIYVVRQNPYLYMEEKIKFGSFEINFDVFNALEKIGAMLQIFNLI